MRLDGLLQILRDVPSYRTFLRTLRAQTATDDAPSLGVLRSARPFVLSAFACDWNAPIVYITARVDRAYNVSEQIPVWLGDSPEERGRILRFAEPAPFFYERAPWGESAIRNRIETLTALMRESDGAKSNGVNDKGGLHAAPPVIVTSARALMQRTMPTNLFRQGTMTLKPGQRHRIDELLNRWVRLGYEAANVVVEPSTFSRRGGILDVYPPAMETPVRIEFFDDEIESLRAFDPATQRSIGRLEAVTITPAREALPENTPQIAAHLASWFAALPDAAADMTRAGNDATLLENGTAFPFLEYYLPYLYPNPISLLDYAPLDALIIVEDWAELRDTITAIEESAEKTRAEKLAGKLIAEDHPLPYLPWAAVESALHERRVITMSQLDSGADEGVLRGLLSPENRFGGQLKPMLTQVKAMGASGDRVVAVSAQAARLTDLWNEGEAIYASHPASLIAPPPPRSITFIDGVLQEGWRLRTGEGDVHLLTDAEIFGWSRPEPRRRKTGSGRKSRTAENTYSDLTEGDYVVHIDYGLGRFAGLRHRTLESVEREYLVIEYAGNDTLFVPIHQADRLTRYVGKDDRTPTLHRLGQQDWIRIRTKAQKAAEDEARELLAVYAERAASVKTPVAPDTPWQHELEASFPYVETEDQLKAVRAVKEDMEAGHPMDRLICGDVGYGKTEVALRAAFKAVTDGRQVAILVPTTILAQQHYDTFSRRLSAFPVKVEMMSRFRTKEEQNKILPKVAAGEIDILIGTHRLLGNDVTFQNLGLVVIDEEQRFGVKHKEHFKRLRSVVDVLTLTATPIPRTLYMGLSGVRDISMIQTPPEERLPVISHVGSFDDRLVRQAVLRELERGGQIFVVHNRVQSIPLVQERLETIVPEARIAVAHGQMDERLLEAVMEQFGNGEFDILLSTSIIESGLDIPNANTLIVDRADWFGLAQLYQLRGRVGRSAQQAYAYFFHPSANRLNEDARLRLETLSEYNDLGSGYQIAMRDLELRGAGDILSTRQTGHVAAIGLHLYTQMLASAVRDLKNGGGQNADGDAAPRLPVSQSTILIDLPLPAYLPTDWMPDMGARLQIYRRIGGLITVDEVNAMRTEFIDRFGALPDAVEGMLYQIEIKLLAQRANASAVLWRAGTKFRAPYLEVRLSYLVEMNRDRLERLLGEDITVTRTAVEAEIGENGNWQARLPLLLTQLGDRLRTPVAIGM